MCKTKSTLYFIVIYIKEAITATKMALNSSKDQLPPFPSEYKDYITHPDNTF